LQISYLQNKRNKIKRKKEEKKNGLTGEHNARSEIKIQKDTP